VAVPEFHRFIDPALRTLANGESWHWRELLVVSSKKLGISSSDAEERILSGSRTKVEDRIQWALTYLRQAGVVKRTGRGQVAITERGKELLDTKSGVIELEHLEQFPEYVAFKKRSKKDIVEQIPVEDLTPQDRMAIAHKEYQNVLRVELLQRLKLVPPARFEEIVGDLVHRLGYGAPEPDAVKIVGGTGDGGIDGIIRQDRLGLENIYLQAKRFKDSTVGTASINEFIGALTTRGATKGVFITTSSFSSSARDIVKKLTHVKISLIDGEELVQMMLEVRLGVTAERVFEINRIDSDYLDEG